MIPPDTHTHTHKHTHHKLTENGCVLRGGEQEREGMGEGEGEGKEYGEGLLFLLSRV